MKKKLVLGALAGAAAVALAVGGTTYAAFSDYGSINNNSVGAGILKLKLTDNSTSATGTTPLSFGNIAPGWPYYPRQAIFIASSTGDSVPDADLYLSINSVTDIENGCANTSSEKADDPTCDQAGDTGELSRVISMLIHTYAAPDAATCKGYVQSAPGQAGDPGPTLNGSVLKNELGNLADPTQVDPHKWLISDKDAPLKPGDGVCVVFNSYWPTAKTGTIYGGLANLPSDNAAQGDSLTFNARFDLIQHTVSPAPVALP